MKNTEKICLCHIFIKDCKNLNYKKKFDYLILQCLYDFMITKSRHTVHDILLRLCFIADFCIKIHIQGGKKSVEKRTALSFLWPAYISDHEAGSQEGSFIETFAFIISKINCHNERLSIFFRSLPFRHAFFQWGLLFQFQLVWPWSCTHIRSFILFRNIPAY